MAIRSSPLIDRRAFFAVCVAMVVGVWGVTAEAQGWEKIGSRDGVTAYRKFVEGFELPVIKGVGVIPAGIYDLLAVMEDVPSYPSWMESCREARLIKNLNEYERIIYNRTAVPWPLSDRDAVVQSKITVDPVKKTVKIAFQSIRSSLPGAGVVDGVVRMPILKGFYLLEVIDEGKTRVTYQAQADPGGFLPDWLVESASADIPLNTITSLRKRVAVMEGKYTTFLEKWDPAHGGVGVGGVTVESTGVKP